MNKKNQPLTKYVKKLIIEAVIFSVMIGLLIGFSITLCLAVIFYFLKLYLIITLIVVFIVTSITSSILLYFYKYKPNVKEAARRLDKAGFEERLITMLEYEKSNHVIADMQREDTLVKLKTKKDLKVPLKPLKKIVTVFIIVGLISITSIVLLNVRVHGMYVKKYLITFDSNGGTEVPSQTITGGDQIKEPIIPKKEGYDFYYWYEDDITLEYDFNEPVFNHKTLTAKWEEKSDIDKLIEKLIKELRTIVDNAKVSDTLKEDLHKLIDKLEENIKKEDTLEMKIAKIEEARKEILRRIQEELDNIKVLLIGEALKDYESTFQLGDAILSRKPKKIDLAIDKLVEDHLSISDRQAQIEKLFQTADEIEASLEKSDEENDRLRKTLQDLADYLRYLAKEKEEGEKPDEVLDNEFIEEAEAVKEELKDILGDPQSSEEALKEDVDQAFNDAIGDMSSETEESKNEDKVDEEPKEPGEGETEEGEGNPIPEDQIPTIIDGITKYIEELENLKQSARERLLDPNLTDEERDAINKYIRNIDMEIKEITSGNE